MYSTPIPWKVISAHLGLGILTEGWTLDAQPEFDTPRSFTSDVIFASPFQTPPVIHLSLTGFDMDQRDTSRITLKAENITETGFRAFVATWATTRVYSVEFNWLAIGP